MSQVDLQKQQQVTQIRVGLKKVNQEWSSIFVQYYRTDSREIHLKVIDFCSGNKSVQDHKYPVREYEKNASKLPNVSFKFSRHVVFLNPGENSSCTDFYSHNDNETGETDLVAALTEMPPFMRLCNRSRYCDDDLERTRDEKYFDFRITGRGYVSMALLEVLVKLYQRCRTKLNLLPLQQGFEPFILGVLNLSFKNREHEMPRALVERKVVNILPLLNKTGKLVQMPVMLDFRYMKNDLQKRNTVKLPWLQVAIDHKPFLCSQVLFDLDLSTYVEHTVCLSEVSTGVNFLNFLVGNVADLIARKVDYQLIEYFAVFSGFLDESIGYVASHVLGEVIASEHKWSALKLNMQTAFFAATVNLTTLGICIGPDCLEKDTKFRLENNTLPNDMLLVNLNSYPETVKAVNSFPLRQHQILSKVGNKLEFVKSIETSSFFQDGDKALGKSKEALGSLLIQVAGFINTDKQTVLMALISANFPSIEAVGAKANQVKAIFNHNLSKIHIVAARTIKNEEHNLTLGHMVLKTTTACATFETVTKINTSWRFLNFALDNKTIAFRSDSFDKNQSIRTQVAVVPEDRSQKCLKSVEDLTSSDSTCQKLYRKIKHIFKLDKPETYNNTSSNALVFDDRSFLRATESSDSKTNIQLLTFLRNTIKNNETVLDKTFTNLVRKLTEFSAGEVIDNLALLINMIDRDSVAYFLAYQTFQAIKPIILKRYLFDEFLASFLTLTETPDRVHVPKYSIHDHLGSWMTIYNSQITQDSMFDHYLRIKTVLMGERLKFQQLCLQKHHCPILTAVLLNSNDEIEQLVPNKTRVYFLNGAILSMNDETSAPKSLKPIAHISASTNITNIEESEHAKLIQFSDRIETLEFVNISTHEETRKIECILGQNISVSINTLPDDALFLGFHDYILQIDANGILQAVFRSYLPLHVAMAQMKTMAAKLNLFLVLFCPGYKAMIIHPHLSDEILKLAKQNVAEVINKPSLICYLFANRKMDNIFSITKSTKTKKFMKVIIYPNENPNFTNFINLDLTQQCDGKAACRINLKLTHQTNFSVSILVENKLNRSLVGEIVLQRSGAEYKFSNLVVFSRQPFEFVPKKDNTTFLLREQIIRLPNDGNVYVVAQEDVNSASRIFINRKICDIEYYGFEGHLIVMALATGGSQNQHETISIVLMKFCKFFEPANLIIMFENFSVEIGKWRNWVMKQRCSFSMYIAKFNVFGKYLAQL